MASEPIASTLFRFVTLRNPKLLSKKEKERGFIYYPSQEKANSHFLVDLDTEDDGDERRELLNSRLATFNFMTKRSIVEAVEPTLYEFSDWLMKNKNILTTSEAATKSAGVSQLSTNDLISLWDNLHYQVLSKKSVAVREAIIRMIVADNFLKKNDYGSLSPNPLINNDEELRRLANAYVVIENGVLNNHESRTNAGIGESTTQKQFNLLNKQLEAFEAKFQLDILKKAKSELLERIEINEQENSKALETANETYESDLVTAYSNATKVTDSESGLVSYENLTLPTLNYTPTTIFDTNNLQGKVSDETIVVFTKLTDEGVNDEKILLRRIDEKTKKLSETLNKKASKKSKTLLLNGSLIKIKENFAPINSYAISATPNPKDPDVLLLNINLSTGKSDVVITDSDLQIVFEEEVTVIPLEIKQVYSFPTSIIISNDGQEISIPNDTKALNLTGTITLDGDEILEIDTKVTLDSKKSNGEMVSQRLAQEPVTVEHHGIKKIGVADFQRVDQEVCCYVPGEVSRIENILAKEYRERSTRQLLSTENITETIEENEVENLSDTTTSERNELTSEVSTLLSQDESKNYGASAGVSGSFKAFGGQAAFYADAYYDGASSSSSSNSNSTSQTYAEEITRRALERVVQKVTKKRTSRILREFEENNKHGFDNRGGTEHVTGVYRWVDKIYTNKLINYGKRLIYEFNVPEPSRFFKEAIIEIIEGENPQQISGIPGGLVAPSEPQPIDFTADEIDIYNYLDYAARYQASVNAPLDRYLNISKSFSGKDPNHTGGDDSKIQTIVGNDEVEIPEGYQVTKVEYAFVIYPDNFNGTPRGWMTIGGKKSSQVQNGNALTGTIYGLNIKNKLSFSYSAGESPIASGSIKVYCERTTDGLDRWRNETYDAIVSAYQARVNEYNDWLYANFEPNLPTIEDSTKKLEFNPLLNRALEKRELKRLAVDMMARPFNIATGRNHYLTSNSHPHLTSTLNKHSDYVKFFEQAFEWEIMAYIFYPYFYSNLHNWKSLVLESNGTDPIFQAFLQSGMARMVVPVRPGFEKAVAYFMETGDVMVGDQLAVDRDDDLYISIAQEMEQPSEGVVEKEWETRVPTALTIVQANAAPLQENGLPCCHNAELNDNLAYGSSRMYLEGESPA